MQLAGSNSGRNGGCQPDFCCSGDRRGYRNGYCCSNQRFNADRRCYQCCNSDWCCYQRSDSDRRCHYGCHGYYFSHGSGDDGYHWNAISLNRWNRGQHYAGHETRHERFWQNRPAAA